MVANLISTPRFFWRDPSDDTPLAGGKVYTYIAGTTTPKTTWADYDQVSTLPNPIILDADGGADIYGSGAYRIIVHRADDTLVAEVDDVVVGRSAADEAGINGGEAVYTVDHFIDIDDNGLVLIANRPTAITFNIDNAISLGENFAVSIKNIGLGTLTLDPSLTDLIDGASTLEVTSGASLVLLCNGTGFRSIFLYDQLIENAKDAAIADAEAYTDDAVTDATQRGHIFGLSLTKNVTDAANDIDITSGEAVNDTLPPVLMKLASAITKRLDAAWAVGTNAGMLDTGSVANALYHLYLIQRSDTGVVDILASLSATSPTMPTNYDQKRLIGAVVRQSATNANPVQYGTPSLTREYVSPEQAIVANTLITLQHGLGVIPKDMDLRIVCKSAEFNYDVGDEVQLTGSVVNGAGAGAVFLRGTGLSASATNIYISLNGSTLSVVNRGGASLAAITYSSWQFIVRARA